MNSLTVAEVTEQVIKRMTQTKIMKNLLIKWIFIYECLNKYNSIFL